MKKRIYSMLTLAGTALLLCGCCGNNAATEIPTDALDFKTLAASRFSVRDYQPREVEQEKLDYILECARLAPSASNRQPWFYYVAVSEEAREIAVRSSGQEWLRTAPVIIVACCNDDKAWIRSIDGKNFGDVDITIGLDHLALAATEQGLGTCWIAHFDPTVIREEFDLPDNMSPVLMMPVGYTAEGQAPKSSRKPLEEIMRVI